MENNEFMEDIEQNEIDWNSIDISKIPSDIDITPIDNSYESYDSNIDTSVAFADIAGKVLDFIVQKQNDIRKVCEELNEGIFNSLKAKVKNLVKLDDGIVYQKVIDSTIKYKITHNFDDLYSLYKKLNDKDIRKFCYVEIKTMYVQQLRTAIANSHKHQRSERNEKIFQMIDEGVKYADIAATFGMALVSIKKLAQQHKGKKNEYK